MSHHDPPAVPSPTVAAAEVYRAAGEHRRSLLYVACGGVAAVVLVASAPQPVPQPVDLARLVPLGLLMIVLPLAAWLYLTTWRLCVDEAGLWRRRLGSWSCWDWETIASGKVRYLRKHGLLWNSSHPWWDKAIGIGLLGREAKPVLELLKRVLPEEPIVESSEPLADEIALRTWFPFRWIRIRQDGIEIDRAGGSDRYRWEQIERLRLIGYPHGDSYIYSVELVLPGRDAVRGDLAGLCIDGQRCWRFHVRNAPWTRQLAALVPPVKWQRFEMSGDMRSVEEGRYRSEFWKKRARILFVFPALGVALLPLVAWKFVPGMWALWNIPFPFLWKVLALLAGFLTMVMPTIILCIVSWHVRDQFLEHQRDAERQLRELIDAGGTE